MWIWLAVWGATGAHAQQEEHPPSVGELVVPLTPSEGLDRYVGVFEVAHAEGSWTSDDPAFLCAAVGDYLQVIAERQRWPSVMPKKVICREDAGRRKVKAKIRVDGSVTHRSMLVADGTLVMPRRHKASVIYRGEPPRPDLVVQRGSTGSLTIHCKVVPGPALEVIVDPESKDGVGYCTLRTNFGETMRVPIRIVTAKYRGS